MAEIGGSYWNSLERQVGPDCESFFKARLRRFDFSL